MKGSNGYYMALNRRRPIPQFKCVRLPACYVSLKGRDRSTGWLVIVNGASVRLNFPRIDINCKGKRLMCLNINGFHSGETARKIGSRYAIVATIENDRGFVFEFCNLLLKSSKKNTHTCKIRFELVTLLFPLITTTTMTWELEQVITNSRSDLINNLNICIACLPTINAFR